MDYGIEVNNEHLKGYLKDDIDDMSRLGKIDDNIRFYSKEVYSDIKKAKKSNAGDKVDIYDSVINPSQNIGVGTGDLTFRSLTQQSNRGLSWQLSAIDQSMRDIPYFQNGARWKATTATRQGIDLNSNKLSGIEINEIQKDIKRLNTSLRNLIFEGEYYGFAGGLLVFSNDSTLSDEDFKQPIEISKIKKNSFLGIKVLTRLYRIVPDSTQLLDIDDIVNGSSWGASAELIGMPKYYWVSLDDGDAMKGDKRFLVHASRILTYRTEHLSYVENKIELNMGVSMLERTYADMAKYETLLGQTVKMAQRSNVPVLKSDNGSMATLNNDQALTDIFSKLRRMKLAMSNSNMVVIDKDDSFTFENASFQDVPTVLEVIQDAFSYAIGAPKSAIFKGTNSTKEEEEALYFVIESIQDLNMRNWFLTLIPILVMNRYGKEITSMDFDFNFKSLYRQTEKEKAETLKIITDVVTDLYDRNLIDIESGIQMVKVAQTNVSDMTNEYTKEYLKYAQSGEVYNKNIKNKINFDIELGKTLNQNKGNENEKGKKGLTGVVNPASNSGGDKGGNPKVKKKPTPTLIPEKE